MRKEDYPRWLRIAWDVRLLMLCAVLIAVGTYSIALGHTAGKLVGVVLVVIAALVAARTLLWPQAKRLVRPS